MTRISPVPALAAQAMSVYSILAAVRGNPAVETGLLLAEQVAYCTAWKMLVNAASRPFRVFETAKGPDISTVLFSTNATDVRAIDNKPVRVDVLEFYRAHWEDLEDPLCTYEPTQGGEREFPKTQSLRRHRGYWDKSDIHYWSLERLICLELKKMGVLQNSIKISGSLGRVTLRFPWAFPGEEPVQRQVLYLCRNYADLRHSDGRILSPIHGHFRKAAMDCFRHDARILPIVSQWIEPGGCLLLGALLGDADKTMAHRRTIEAALGNEFLPLTLPDPFVEMMRQRPIDPSERTPPHHDAYGWEMQGYRKKDA